MPSISIVIPTLNRTDVLPRTLDRLERQTVPAEAIEVIVVGDPQERDRQGVERALAGRPFEIRHLVRHAPGVSAARNDGWREARASLVMFLGDDILASPGLVAEHLAFHERRPEREVAVLGKVDWARELRVTAFMRWLEHGVQFDYPAIRGEDAGWGRFYTSNVSVKRELLELVDGFDEDFEFAYEDLDIAKRMDEHGLRLLYAPDATAEHLHAVTLEDYARRMATVAAAEHRFAGKHPDFEPYFKPMLERALAAGVGRMRLAALARWVPRSLPWLGPRVWQQADLRFRRALAPSFLEAWERAHSTSVR